MLVQSVVIFRSLMNPLALHGSIFGLAVLLNYFLPIDHPSESTWVILFLETFWFYLGSLTGLCVARLSGGRVDAGSLSGFELRMYTRAQRVATAVLAVYIAIFVKINFPRLVEAWGTGLGKFSYVLYSFYYLKEIWYLPQVEGLGLLVALLAGVSDGLSGKPRWKHNIWSVGLVMILALLTGTRTILLVSLLLYAFARYLVNFVRKARRLGSAEVRSKKGRLWTELPVVIGAILVVAAVSSGRAEGEVRDLGLEYAERQLSVVDRVALYVGGPIARLEHAVAEEQFRNFGPGAFTLGPFARFICRAITSDEVCQELYPHIQPFSQIPFAWNTGTYIMDVWFDFGLAGVVLAAFSLGFTSTSLFYQASRGRISAAIVGAFIMTMIAFSFHFTLTFAGNFTIAFVTCLIFISVSSLIRTISDRFRVRGHKYIIGPR
jgi:oligosaccharide repeat unit polymerase